MIRILLILAIILCGCQTGRIPCPKFKKTKSGLFSRSRPHYPQMTADARAKDDQPRLRREPDPRYVGNVSIEEWDCPQPGEKKYLPKRIRQNIRRNARRIQDDARRVSADSVNID